MDGKNVEAIVQGEEPGHIEPVRISADYVALYGKDSGGGVHLLWFGGVVW